jgi:flagellar motor switch protein FliN/FliY
MGGGDTAATAAAETADVSALSDSEVSKLNNIIESIVRAQASSISAVTANDTEINTKSTGVKTLNDAISAYSGEVLTVKISYSAPVSSNVFFVFKGEDAKAIATLMSGSDVAALDDMAISAVQEAFNQMVGSADTQVSTEHNITMTNSGPKLSVGSIPDNFTIPEGEYFAVETSINVSGSLNSEFLQLYPTQIAKAMTAGEVKIDTGSQEMDVDSLISGEGDTGDLNIQTAEFSPLTQTAEPEATGNINLLLDVPMEVTVELGRSVKTVQEVLSLGEGSIIELDKLAGEPVDLLVNGKPIAKGEVVVIDENFGVRVTEIVNQKARIPQDEM